MEITLHTTIEALHFGADIVSAPSIGQALVLVTRYWRELSDFTDFKQTQRTYTP